MIDRFLHPYFKDGVGYIAWDTALHFFVEGNPAKSFKKFLQYNLRPLTEELRKRKR